MCDSTLPQGDGGEEHDGPPLAKPEGGAVTLHANQRRDHKRHRWNRSTHRVGNRALVKWRQNKLTIFQALANFEIIVNF